MTSAETWNHVVFFVIVILPITLIAGPMAMAFAVILGVLWLIAAAPGLLWIAAPFAVLWMARWIVKDILLGLLLGFFGGLGLRASGFARRLSVPPRRERVQRHRKPPRGYRPNEDFPDPQDDIPF
jgi:hypothetical protein